jgi:uncharacterized repeat protein (TIGR01451 family)
MYKRLAVLRQPAEAAVGPAAASPSSTTAPSTAGTAATSTVVPSPPAIVGPTIAPPSGGGNPADRPGASGYDNGVFTRQSPVLAIETVGPRRVAVNKEASYEVVIRNSGEIAAEQIVVNVSIPAWVDVAGAETSAGKATAPSSGTGGTLLWQLGRLEAKGREKLTLRLVPRQSRPFDLPVKWDCTPVSAQALIEVQEPRLAVVLHGPREVQFGKGEVYRLEVHNAGNGDTDNVTVALWPNGPGERQPAATHTFGRLGAGQKKSIEVELTARQEGKVLVGIEARGDGGLRTQITEEIVVRRAGLKIEVEAPRVQYVGTEATYRIRVSNPGSAPAVKPVVTATLPAGARFVSSPQNGRPGADPTQVVWNLETLPAGAETTVIMIAAIGAAGPGRIDAHCVAEGGLSASGSAVTQVEAAASLTLVVEEPTGPVSVSSDATYQLTIQNRGTAAAENVEVELGKGNVPEEIEVALLRAEPGQEIRTTVHYGDEAGNPELKNQDVDFVIQVKDVKRKLAPEIDDDFARSISPEFESLAVLKDRIRKDLEEMFQDQRDVAVRNQIMEQIRELGRFDVPVTLVTAEAKAMLEDFKTRLRRQGLDPAAAGLDEAKLLEDFKEQAQKKVRAGIVLGRISDQEKIDVTPEDVDKEIEKAASRMGQPAQIIKEMYMKNNMMPTLHARLLEEKTLQAIRADAIIEVVDPAQLASMTNE